MLEFHGFINQSEKGQFHRFIGLRDHDDDLPDAERWPLENSVLNRINSLQIFEDVIFGVEKLLEKTLSKEVFDLAVNNCSKTVTGMAIRISDPRDPEDLTPSEEPEFLFIPEDRICAVPTREVNPGAIFANLFGTPIEIHLRERGLLKTKKTVSEFQYHVYRIIFKKVCPALEEGLKSGRLTKVEYNYVHDFLTVFQYLMFRYQGIKKGHIDINRDKPSMPSNTYLASNKRIENTTNHFIKTGMDPIVAESVSASCFNRKRIKCITRDCNNTFVPRNNRHQRCQDCSKPKNYLKKWRATRADEENKAS